jgi:hypothetical protein
MQELKLHTFTFQFTNFYDRNNLEFTERVTKHLRESIYLLMDETEIPKNETDSIILGDIIYEKFLSSESRHFVYFLEDYNALDEIINQLNIDIFGEELADIPDSDIDLVVKIVYNFS